MCAVMVCNFNCAVSADHFLLLHLLGIGALEEREVGAKMQLQGWERRSAKYSTPEQLSPIHIFTLCTVDEMPISFGSSWSPRPRGAR